MTTGIYTITNLISDTRYVGSSHRIERRWHQHKYDLRRGVHANQHLQHAWDKYGEKAFQFDVVHTCPEGELVHWEDHYIKLYPTGKLYNLDGFDRGRKRTSDETKAKISVSLKSSPAHAAACAAKVGIPNAGRIGKHHSDESKAKTSNSLKGRTQIGEHRDRRMASLALTILVKKILANQ